MRGRFPTPPLRAQTVAAVVGAVLVVVFAALVLSYEGEAPRVETTSRSFRTQKRTSTTTTEAPTTTETTPPPTEAPTTLPPVTEPPTTLPPVTEPPPPVFTGGALCIGDSVMLGASDRYYGTLSMCGIVDAEVGRPMSAGASVLSSHLPAPQAVVIHLGTNGYTNAAEIDAVLEQIGDVPIVVLVNVQVNGTRMWESSVNAEIADAVSRWPNARLADWKGASDGHGDYFRDGIHISAAGAEALASVISATLG